MAHTDCTLATVSLLFLLCLVDLILGCSPPSEDPPLENKAHFSDAVVWGTVLEVMEDSVFGHYDHAYAVRFKVKCAYKTHTTHEIPIEIQIHGAGEVPGLCHSTNLTENRDYTLFLSYQNNRYEPLYEQLDGNTQYLDEVLTVCELEPSYPEGLTKDTAGYECPEIYKDDCMMYVPPTEPVSEPEVTPEPGKETKYEPGTPGTEVTAAASSDDDSGAERTHFLSLGVATVCMVLAAIIV